MPSSTFSHGHSSTFPVSPPLSLATPPTSSFGASAPPSSDDDDDVLVLAVVDTSPPLLVTSPLDVPGPDDSCGAVVIGPLVDPSPAGDDPQPHAATTATAPARRVRIIRSYMCAGAARLRTDQNRPMIATPAPAGTTVARAGPRFFARWRSTASSARPVTS